jgi:putative transposase
MARPLRIEFPGALYHVTARGNERRPIVADDHDRAQWVATLAGVVRRFGWRLYAWCLMQNHHHLLVETPAPNLARGMRQLNGVYAQAFNRRHRRDGHLFGGRYWAILVEREPHLLELCRYVVLNPLRVRRPTATLARYRWSSYRATAGLEAPPDFLASAWTLAHFGRDRLSAQRAYRRFVARGRGADPWGELRAGIYLGSDAFVRAHQPSTLPDGEIVREQRQPLRHSLARLFAQERDRAILAAYHEHGYRLREIAAELGVHHATVSRRLRRLEQDHDAGARADGALRRKTRPQLARTRPSA